MATEFQKKELAKAKAMKKKCKSGANKIYWAARVNAIERLIKQSK